MERHGPRSAKTSAQPRPRTTAKGRESAPGLLPIGATSCPPTRRAFNIVWHEIAYLHSKAEYWWYRNRSRRARRFAARLKKLLGTVADSHEAILGESSWALFAEMDNDLSAAARYRENQVRLVRRIIELGHAKPGNDQHRIVDLLMLIASLYERQDDLIRASARRAEAAELRRS